MRILDASIRLDAADLPREVLRRLARRAIGEVIATHAVATTQWSESANIEALLDALLSGRRATQAGVIASPHGPEWRFRPAPPRRSSSPAG